MDICYLPNILLKKPTLSSKTGCLSLYGNGTIVVDNLQTEYSEATNKYTCIIVATAGGMQSTTLALNIRGDGGFSGINAKNFAPSYIYTTAQIPSIIFTNWRLRNMYPGYLAGNGSGWVISDSIKNSASYCSSNNYKVNLMFVHQRILILLLSM